MKKISLIISAALVLISCSSPSFEGTWVNSNEKKKDTVRIEILDNDKVLIKQTYLHKKKVKKERILGKLVSENIINLPLGVVIELNEKKGTIECRNNSYKRLK